MPRKVRSYCQATVFAGNRIDPPEYCENETVPAGEFCERHQQLVDELEDRYADGPDHVDWEGHPGW
jgi:hypothetical protein